MNSTFIGIVITILLIALIAATIVSKWEDINEKKLIIKILIIMSSVIITISPTFISFLLNVGYIDIKNYKTAVVDVVGMDIIDDKYAEPISPDNLNLCISDIRYKTSSNLDKKSTSSKIDIVSTIESKNYLTSNPTQAKEYYRLINYINKYNEKHLNIDAYNHLGEYSLKYVDLLISSKEKNQYKIYNYVNVGINAYVEYLKFENADIALGYNQIGELYQTLSNYLSEGLQNNCYDEKQIGEIVKYRNKLMMLSYSYFYLAEENTIGKSQENNEFYITVKTNLASIECDIGVAFDDNQLCLDWFSESLKNTISINAGLDKVCNLIAGKIDEFREHANALGLNSSDYYINLAQGNYEAVNNSAVDNNSNVDDNTTDESVSTADSSEEISDNE